MDSYLAVKLVHIVSATVLFGTGMGTAFFMLRAWQSGSEETLRVTTVHVVQADWFFTTPAVIVQLATGLWLTDRLAIPFTSVWFVLVIALFAAVGACWIPVVWVQLRIRDLISDHAPRDHYRPLMRWWVGLGIPAFACVLVLFAIMVYKPWIGSLLMTR